MFSTSRAKPKKFCACLLTRRPPGIGQKGTWGTRCRQSRVWRHADIWSCHATPPPLVSLWKMLTAPDFFFFFNLLLQQSKGAFQEALDIIVFLLQMRCVSKVHGQVILPALWGKEKGMIYGLRALIIVCSYSLSTPPFPCTLYINTI